MQQLSVTGNDRVVCLLASRSMRRLHDLCRRRHVTSGTGAKSQTRRHGLCTRRRRQGRKRGTGGNGRKKLEWNRRFSNFGTILSSCDLRWPWGQIQTELKKSVYPVYVSMPLSVKGYREWISLDIIFLRCVPKGDIWLIYITSVVFTALLVYIKSVEISILDPIHARK